jgi:hypothetical protein
MVDLAHEALMEGWEEFAKWREAKRQLLRLRDRLEDAWREWDTEGRKYEDSIRGSLLARVRENWQHLESELDATVIEFYHLSDTYDAFIQERFRKQPQEEEKLRKELLETKAKMREINLQISSNVYEQENISFQDRLTRQLLTIQDNLHELHNKQLKLEKEKLDYLSALQRFEQRMGNAQKAAKWLNYNQETLVETAAKATLDADTNLTKSGGVMDSPDKVQRFRWDVDDYIDWLRSSLELGAIIPLEETDLIPTLSSSAAYAAAFDFIKEKAVIDLSDDIAGELEVCLSYLINYFTQNQSNS